MGHIPQIDKYSDYPGYPLSSSSLNYKGKPVEELTKAELIKILYEVNDAYLRLGKILKEALIS